jgi:hypothetical protein
LGDGKDRWRTGGFTATYRVNDNVTLAAGVAMVTGQKKEFYPKSNPNDKSLTIANTETPHAYRSGVLYGGVIHKGRASFVGYNSERFLHGKNNDNRGIQNKIHYSRLFSTPWLFEYRGLPSRILSYFGNYSNNSLVY